MQGCSVPDPSKTKFTPKVGTLPCGQPPRLFGDLPFILETFNKKKEKKKLVGQSYSPPLYPPPASPGRCVCVWDGLREVLEGGGGGRGCSPLAFSHSGGPPVVRTQPEPAWRLTTAPSHPHPHPGARQPGPKSLSPSGPPPRPHLVLGRGSGSRPLGERGAKSSLLPTRAALGAGKDSAAPPAIVGGRRGR